MVMRPLRRQSTHLKADLEVLVPLYIVVRAGPAACLDLCLQCFSVNTMVINDSTQFALYTWGLANPCVTQNEPIPAPNAVVEKI